MSFYTFLQNNPGGRFIGFETVIIQASSARDANNVAPEYGIYFDGVRSRRDCSCCGDRWVRVTEMDANPMPSVFDCPADENDPKILIVYL